MIAIDLTALTSQPDWLVSAVLGAILGALVAPASMLAMFPIRRLKPHIFHGKWYSYHFSFLGERLVLRYGIFNVRTGIRHRYSVTRLSSGGRPSEPYKLPKPILKYRGRVYNERDHVVMSIAATTHVETAMYRFLGRIPSNTTVIPGLWMSYDHDTNPTAGVAIISREQLSDDEAKEWLRSLMVSDSGAIRITRTAQLRPSS